MVTDLEVPDSPTNKQGCPEPSNVFKSHDILHVIHTPVGLKDA